MSRRGRQIVCQAALLAAVLVAALAQRLPVALADDAATVTVEARVRCFQEYDVSTSGLQNTFEYLVVPEQEDAPLPVDEGGNTFDAFSLRRDEELWLSIPITVAASASPRTYAYRYELRPATPTLAGGLYYVDVLSTSLAKGANTYYLEVFVREGGEDPAATTVVPMVHVEGWDGPKVSDPGWRIGYEKPKQDDNKSQRDDTKPNDDSDDKGQEQDKDVTPTPEPTPSPDAVPDSRTSAGTETPADTSQGSDASSTTGTTTVARTSAATGTTGTPLSKTGDETPALPGMLCAALAAMLLACGMVSKAGDGDE